MAITLTENAADRIKDFLAQRGKGLGLRLGVKTTGCSGMAYVMEYVDEIEDSDVVFEEGLSAAERAERGSYTGCIAGALSMEVGSLGSGPAMAFRNMAASATVRVIGPLWERAAQIS